MPTSATVTQRRTRGRSRDHELLVPREESGSSVASYNIVSSFLKLFSAQTISFQGRGSKASSSKSAGVVYVSLPVKLCSLVGAACLVWLCLDPLLHANRSPLFVPSFLKKDHQRPVVKPEVIYPRGVVYDGNAVGEKGQAHFKAFRNVTTKERHQRVYVRPLSSQLVQSQIKDSEVYRGLDVLREKKYDDCQVKYDWQRANRQNCNSMHEATDLTTRPTAVVPVPVTQESTTTRAATAATMVVNRYQFLTHGYFRDVFMLLDDEHSHYKKIVFKPMRYEHDFDYRNFDRMRRDALTMDQLTGAKYILQIYGNCGTSGLFEFADGGDIETTIWPNKTPEQVRNTTVPQPPEDENGPHKLPQMEKLHIATQAAMGLASLHNMDEEGRASVAHTDISPGQFIKVNGVYKLNDFNRARFLKQSTSNGTTCAFYNYNNWGKIRAPEEYQCGPETEMVDIYSFGNIMYMLLQGKWPFDDIPDLEVADMVANNTGRPTIDADIWNSTDPVDRVLKQAMIMCKARKPHERKSARQIETYLKNSMRKLDPGRLEEWGDA